jgi:hypothetical protein
MEERDKRKFNHFKEKIRRTFKRIALAGVLSFSILTSSQSALLNYISYPPETFYKYRHEFSLIEKGNEYNNLLSDEDYNYYKEAIKLIKEKQEKIGEGKDIKLDFLRVYSVYSMARACPEPEHAEKYLLEAKELAKKYYEIWKDGAFLNLQANILENLGNIYFFTIEDVRNGKKSILLLDSPIIEPDGISTDRMVIKSDSLYHFLGRYPVKKIINSKNFEISYYIIAKEYYKEYLKFCKEKGLEEILKEDPTAFEDFKKANDRVLLNLQIIDEILSKYDPNYKKEETKENQIKGPTEKKKKK